MASKPVVLQGAQKIMAGRLILAASKHEAAADKFKADPKEYLKSVLPDTDHEIVPIFNEAEKTHYVVPFHEFLMDGTGGNETYPGHPREYDSNDGSHVDPESDPEEAYEFRVGDYVFAGCG